MPTDWLGRWNLDPVLLIALAAATGWMWHLSKTPADRRMIVGAIALSLLLFVSPFCALSSALFSARVTHHVLLVAILAPLMLFAVPHQRRWPGSLALWTGLQTISFWLWHAPGPYAAALSSNILYWVMQATLLGTAMGFWASLRRSAAPTAIAALLITTVQMGLLGALITFAGVPLFAPHLATTVPWGLSALEDQQLAGLIMWAPSAALYLGSALFVAHRWLSQEAREVAA